MQLSTCRMPCGIILPIVNMPWNVANVNCMSLQEVYQVALQIAEDGARRRSAAAAAWDAHLPTAVATDTLPSTASRDEEISAASGVDPISKALAKLAAAGASNDQ